MCPCSSNVIPDRGLGGRDADQRLVVVTIRVENRFVELETYFVMAGWALEKIRVNWGVSKSPDFVAAVRARINVSETTVWANCNECWRNISAFYTLGAASFLHNFCRRPAGITKLFQNSVHFGPPIRGELEIRILVGIAARAVSRAVRVNLYWRVRPKIPAHVGGAKEILSGIVWVMDDSDADSLHGGYFPPY